MSAKFVLFDTDLVCAHQLRGVVTGYDRLHGDRVY